MTDSHIRGPASQNFAAAALKSDLMTLLMPGPRSCEDVGALEATRAFLRTELQSYGYRTELVRFGEEAGDYNLLAERTGSDPQAPLMEIGAHYDTVRNCPGADDNGSGVIGLLALARHFSQRRLRRTVRFCFFGAEETGLRGSDAHQQLLTHEGRPFGGCVVFEMIGCRKREANSQGTPVRIPLLLWPPRTGDFIASVTNWRSRHLASAYRVAAGTVQGLKVFPVRQLGGLLQEAMRSDHASYWRAGRPAIMLTDTAEFRNPHYHRPGDTVETVDFEFIAEVTWATAVMAEDWAVAQ